MKEESLWDREMSIPVEDFILETISDDPIEWIVCIRDVVNGSRLFPYPCNRKWAIQFRNPYNGKKKTVYIFLNANWTSCDKEHAIRTIASEIYGASNDSFSDWYLAYTDEHDSKEYPRRLMKSLYKYQHNLYLACQDFFPEDVLQKLEEYA